jgi:hypothetical protein
MSTKAANRMAARLRFGTSTSSRSKGGPEAAAA